MLARLVGHGAARSELTHACAFLAANSPCAGAARLGRQRLRASLQRAGPGSPCLLQHMHAPRPGRPPGVRNGRDDLPSWSGAIADPVQGRRRHVDARHLHGSGRIAPCAFGMGVLQPSVHDVASIEVGWRDSDRLEVRDNRRRTCQVPGFTFWLSRKKLPGSYFVLSAARRA